MPPKVTRNFAPPSQLKTPELSRNFVTFHKTKFANAVVKSFIGVVILKTRVKGGGGGGKHGTTGPRLPRDCYGRKKLKLNNILADVCIYLSASIRHA
jgi:hypothetical protein